MKSLKKTTLASLVGAAALATAGAANATIVVGGENGYEFSIDGNINQFFVYTDDNTTGGDETSEIRDGLLPAFLGFNISMPEVNGLKVGARVSISPSTNGGSYFGDNDGGAAMEQREAFATIDGSFGQVLAGKALGLYGSHNILTEQTLYGVGWGTGDNLQTTLGGIGFGYDYAAWRSQIRYTTPDMNGFKAAFAVVDPQGNAGVTAVGPIGNTGTSTDSEDLRYEYDLTYAGAFDSGSYMLWVSGAHQKKDELAEDLRSWTAGGTLKFSGFEFMAQYTDSEDAYDATNKAEWNSYVVQAGYRFAGTTLVSVNYSEVEDDNVTGTNAASGALAFTTDPSDDTADRITFGVYHDVTSNLKLVAEYSKIEHDDDERLDQDIFALGGFVTW
jgi:hypothetical protein